MAVTAEELAAIDQALGAARNLAESLAALRTSFPHLRWLSCDAGDVTEEPFRSYLLADLHWLDCASYCVQLVDQAEAASGVLLARKMSPGAT